MQLPVGFGAGFGEGIQEELAVLIGAEDVFSVVATVHDVIDRARVVDAEFSGHAGRVEGAYDLSILRTDPFSVCEGGRKGI